MYATMIYLTYSPPLLFRHYLYPSPPTFSLSQCPYTQTNTLLKEDYDNDNDKDDNDDDDGNSDDNDEKTTSTTTTTETTTTVTTMTMTTVMKTTTTRTCRLLVTFPLYSIGRFSLCPELINAETLLTSKECNATKERWWSNHLPGEVASFPLFFVLSVHNYTPAYYACYIMPG